MATQNTVLLHTTPLSQFVINAEVNCTSYYTNSLLSYETVARKLHVIVVQFQFSSRPLKTQKKMREGVKK